MSGKISNKVYKQIQGSEVKMKPCGYFKARSLFWLLVAGFLFAASSLIMGLTLHYLAHLNVWGTFMYSPALLLLALPYFFFAAIIFLIYFASRSYRRSRHMCKHEEWILYSVLLFGCFLIGLSIYSSKMVHALSDPLEKNQTYQKMIVTPKYFWSRPEKGTLSGVVLSANEGRAFIVKSWDGSKWSVVVLNLNNEDVKEVEPRQVIKMVGRKQDQQFLAENIWSWN